MTYHLFGCLEIIVSLKCSNAGIAHMSIYVKQIYKSMRKCTKLTQQEKAVAYIVHIALTLVLMPVLCQHI